MSQEVKMFCNICGKEFAIENMIEVPLDNYPWAQNFIRTCKECGEKKHDEQQEALRRDLLKNFRPLTPSEALEELPGKEVRTAGDTVRCIVTAVDGDRVLAGDKWVSLEELFSEYWFSYNDPCGKKVKR